MTEMTTGLFGVHAAALGLREARLDVLASNLANVDTPGYKARDIDFRRALEAATASAPGADALATTSPAHLAQGGAAGPLDAYRVPLQRSLDGNTVDGEYEHAAFARAALEYRASLSFVEGRARTLMTAITGE